MRAACCRCRIPSPDQSGSKLHALQALRVAVYRSLITDHRSLAPFHPPKRKAGERDLLVGVRAAKFVETANGLVGQHGQAGVGGGALVQLFATGQFFPSSRLTRALGPAGGGLRDWRRECAPVLFRPASRIAAGSPGSEARPVPGDTPGQSKSARRRG